MRRLLPALLLLLSVAFAPSQAEPRPNILWITCEDISLDVGCYGDPYAITPHIDRFAAQGVRYTHAFAPIGVCAPSWH
jgi:N-sulfoglucosamine sulfohydrolase